MKINIKATNLELTTELENYLRERIEHIDKLIVKNPNSEGLMQVELARETMHHKKGTIFRAEFNLRIDGKHFRADTTEEDIRAAIDLARDELTREITSAKQKRATLVRRGARMVKDFLKGFYKK